ncbi:MAG TPA: V-type ATP synthase subunit A [Thermoanaerobaculia bacterium]|nr:V-type ATP synthase subunit A [Thermoanaerobaculia bacterium]
MKTDAPAGALTEVAGSVVRARVQMPLALREVVYVGSGRLLGEVVSLDREIAIIQVYEDTEGLAPGDPLFASGGPLLIELGPGLLGEIFDGVERPLRAIAAREGDFIHPGSQLPPLDREKLWPFEPSVKEGEDVRGGSVIGVVQETAALAHPILVPPGVEGRIVSIAGAGSFRVTDSIAQLETADGTRDLMMLQKWRARVPRPVEKRLGYTMPLVTGQRVLDTFFPLARGASAAMPGGFGTGKTVTQHQLCRYADADVIIFVGCGERGNEMTHLVSELPDLIDPRTNRRLAERTVLIANTSNMPVSAREASIFTGITIGEYYRDLGYNVLLLADSISRWAEALREISGRLEEIPAEEGYPPYLSSSLAAFYERAGAVRTLGGRLGSLTAISAISPPAGDLTEPVTRHAERFVQTFWTLDPRLAGARVFPAVSIRDSYSDVPEGVVKWWESNVDPQWAASRTAAFDFLERAAHDEETARLVGSESLPDRERFVLRLAEVFQEGFLQQSAYDAVDAWCAPKRQQQLLGLFLYVHRRGLEMIDGGKTADAILALPLLADLQRFKSSEQLPSTEDLEKELSSC